MAPAIVHLHYEFESEWEAAKAFERYHELTKTHGFGQEWPNFVIDRVSIDPNYPEGEHVYLHLRLVKE